MTTLSRSEEIANCVTHAAGAVLSVAALCVMVIFTSLQGDAWHIVAASVYGASLVLLYVASALYHGLREGPAKRLFRIFDHMSIFLLIAGSYTPFTLITLRGPWGWSIFGVIWGLAAAGIVFKVFCTGRLHILSTTIYILMGWVAVVAIVPIVRALPYPALFWLLAGGLFYTLGVIFFAWQRAYSHTIWHFFVLAGSLSHFYVIYHYVLFKAARPATTSGL